MTDLDAGAPEIKAYATQPPGGGLSLTLINKGDRSSALTVNTGIHTRRASVIRLSGPAIDAKTGITLGGVVLFTLPEKGPWD